MTYCFSSITSWGGQVPKVRNRLAGVEYDVLGLFILNSLVSALLEGLLINGDKYQQNGVT